MRYATFFKFTQSLIRSFALGNALKTGVTTVIAGRPNAGKSTLLNQLLGEDRAIVSNIAGTTRDVIEETLNIDGILFRLIDTAGIRDADPRAHEAEQRSHYASVRYQPEYAREQDVREGYYKETAPA